MFYNITDMKTINSRIEYFIERKKMTKQEFAESLGDSKGKLSNLLSGRNFPSYETIRNILVKYPEINERWLLVGTGDPIKKEYVREYKTAENDSIDIVNDKLENFAAQKLIDTIKQLKEELEKKEEFILSLKLSNDLYKKLLDKKETL